MLLAKLKAKGLLRFSQLSLWPLNGGLGELSDAFQRHLSLPLRSGLLIGLSFTSLHLPLDFHGNAAALKRLGA